MYESIALTHFSELGLAEPVLRALTEEGYESPTPIQAQAIPHLTAGRDLLGTAQTGTGKTAAFVLPILHALASEEGRSHPVPRAPTSLILAPTRELAAQIAESVRTYGRHVRLRTATVVGGVKPGPQIRSLSRGVDVLIATPGRLLDHYGSGALKLDRIRTIVLDEADQMMDLGFLPAIRRILAALPKDRQTALLSATMPKQIRALAHDFLTDPAEISVAAVSRPIERIEQSLVRVPQAAKPGALIKLLNETGGGRAIVFSRTKHGADKIARKLEQARIPSAAIHGNKSQNQRTRALNAFKSEQPPVLVATDIAARGIDIDDVELVVNFDLPNVPESYVHRIGRTARAGATGVAVAFCDPEENKLLRDIERLIGYRIEPREIEGVDALPAPAERGPRPAGRKGGKPGGHRSGDAKKRGERNRSSKPQHHGGPKPQRSHGEADAEQRADNSHAAKRPAGAKPQGGSPASGQARSEKPRRGKPDRQPGNRNPANRGERGRVDAERQKPANNAKGRESEAKAAEALARLMAEAESDQDKPRRRKRRGGGRPGGRSKDHRAA